MGVLRGEVFEKESMMKVKKKIEMNGFGEKTLRYDVKKNVEELKKTFQKKGRAEN